MDPLKSGGWSDNLPGTRSYSGHGIPRASAPLSPAGEALLSKMNATLKNLLLWAAIFVMVILIFNLFNQGAARRGEIIFSDFIDDVEKGHVEEVTVKNDGSVSGTYKTRPRDGVG